MRRNLHLLTTPGFLLSLSLLLANDFLFKPLFHNWLTGKLSDFAGLFALPLFLATFAPRYRRAIYLLTTAAFGFWKSHSSQPLIDSWNALPLFRVERVVDPTDLIALSVLPLSYFYFQHRRHRFPLETTRFSLRRLATCGVIAVSLFAFTATQRAGDHMITDAREYEFLLSKDELIRKLKEVVGPVRHDRSSDEAVERSNKLRKAPMTEEDRNSYSFSTREKFCDDTIRATVTLHARENRTILRIGYLMYNCNVSDKQHELEATAVFERDVIEKLGGRFIGTAPE